MLLTHSGCGVKRGADLHEDAIVQMRPPTERAGEGAGGCGRREAGGSANVGAGERGETVNRAGNLRGDWKEENPRKLQRTVPPGHEAIEALERALSREGEQRKTQRARRQQRRRVAVEGK